MILTDNNETEDIKSKIQARNKYYLNEAVRILVLKILVNKFTFIF